MSSSARTTQGSGDSGRAQSETVGFVLIVGFVVLGSVLVAVFGAMALDSTEGQLSEERAENALTQFDSKAALVALGDSGSHDASFGSGAADRDELSIDEAAGWLNVTVTNRTTEQVVMYENVTLGALVYQGAEARLAYQGGGVWRATRTGGQMIAPPEFHYQGETLTLPAITIEGDGTLNEDVTIERNYTRTLFPDPSDAELTNPLENHVVNVTVGSEFYRGWGEYFIERTEGEVDMNPDEETARLKLVTPIGEVTVEGALAGQESSGQLLVQGNPHHPCSNSGSHPPYIDSFDSSQGSYCDQYDPDEISDGDELTFGGDIVTDASAGEIQADLISGGEMTLAGQMDYYGNFSHADGCSVKTGPAKDCEDAQEPGYVVEQNDGVEPSDSITRIVRRTVEQFGNNYAPITLTDGDTLTGGEHFTQEIDLDGDDVTFNTTGGDITLAVDGPMHLDAGSNISVVGDGAVDIFVNGTTGGDDMRISDSEVFVPNNNATQVKVLGDENFTAKVVNEAEYSGVIYGPAGEDGNGEAVIDRKGTVYGAVVTGDMTLGEPSGGVGASIHYDIQLEDEQVVPPDKTIIPLTFLHITESRIVVTG
jgi:hypothetical protein